MNIYFIGQKGIPVKIGGIERHVEELSSRLAEKGHNVFVYTRPNYTDPELKNYRGVNLISLSGINTKNFDTITHTFRACLDIRKRDVDIIHFHSIGPASLVWLVKILKPKTPIIATFHSKCYLHRKWGMAARIYLRIGEAIACLAPDRTIAVSRSLSEYSYSKYRKNIDYIPNGVNICDKLEAKEIKKWGLSEDNYILAVSRLVGHKGIHFLIEAYKRINTDKKLVIAGDGFYTDKYVKELKELAENNPKIIFTGRQSGETLAELFSNTYLFVQPSESEGLSIALLEAMAYGQAVLVSDIPENKEAVGENGFIFMNKNLEDLERKLKFLLENPHLLKENGKLNKMRVNSLYNWDRIVEDTDKLYREAAEEKNFGRKQSLIRKFIDLLF